MESLVCHEFQLLCQVEEERNQRLDYALMEFHTLEVYCIQEPNDL